MDRFTLHGVFLTDEQIRFLEHHEAEVSFDVVQEAHDVGGVAVGPTRFYNIKAPTGAEVAVPHYNSRTPLTVKWWSKGFRLTVEKTRDQKILAQEHIPGRVRITMVRGEAFKKENDGTQTNP